MNDFKLSILFVLQKVKTNKKGECPLRCRLTFLKSRKEFSTGIFINPDYWDSGKQKASHPSTDNATLNNKLSLIHQQIDRAFFKEILSICIRIRSIRL
jgi:integrase/recombinase XerD